MKIIGMIGGMSYESTIPYYKIVNDTINEKIGGLHSARCILYSVDFDEIEKCQQSGEWDKSAEILSDAAKALENAGADFFVICTNTMHKVADKVQESVKIPLLHIAEATADELERFNVTKIGLIGTKYTMEQDFYKSKLVDRGFEVIIPESEDILFINSVIFNELCRGVVNKESKDRFIKIIESLSALGAEGVILGCTEIGLLVNEKDTFVPLFDTTEIHAKKAALYSLQ